MQDRPSFKPPKRMTRKRVRNIAIAYVNRYRGSRKRLHEVLSRRVERSLRFHDGDAELWYGWVDSVVEELVNTNGIDEAHHARQIALESHYAGASLRKIQYRLRQKGYPAPVVEQSLEWIAKSVRERMHMDDTIDLDWLALCRYARRRGFGPYARPGREPKPRDKQLASMMRAGFSYALAGRMLETDPEDDTLQ